MRKSLIIALLVLVGAAFPTVAAAQDCQYHNVKIDFSSRTWIDPPMEPFEYCFEVSKVVGTLNGSYLVCFNTADFISSDTIYGDGIKVVEASKYYSSIKTKNGHIDFIEWSWYDGEFGLETGFLKVMGGSGAFEKAFGSLSWTPRFPNLGPVVWFEGYICTPEE